MESYRFYLLSLQNKIGAAVYADARDDADALDKAPATFAISDEFPDIEIWRGKRMVGRITQRT
ncbi:MAG TPA: hypothetical protein VJ822_13390 [Dongiaceae bacterium]|nr:hypothetical protein [Dongiaceae bacterium]